MNEALRLLREQLDACWAELPEMMSDGEAAVARCLEAIEDEVTAALHLLGVLDGTED